MPTTQFLKVTTPDGKPTHGGTGQWSLPRLTATGHWQPGDWWDVGTDDIVACQFGLHLTDADHLAAWLPYVDHVVWLAQADESLPVVVSLDGTREKKWVARRARLLRPVGTPSPDAWSAIHAGRLRTATWVRDMLRAGHWPVGYGPWPDAKVVFGRDRDDEARRHWRLPSEATREREWRKWLRRPLVGSTPYERQAWQQAVARANVHRASQGDTTV